MTTQLSNLHTQRFQELCRIQSPSLREAEVSSYVKGCLDGFGLSWSEDEAAEVVGGNAGNLICSVAGFDDSLTIIVAAHLDTVPPGAVTSPSLHDGDWVNSGDGILGVDNKAAVAAILTALEDWSQNPPAVNVRAVFTVAEEISLLGANALAANALEADAAFVFDHPTPIGTVVTCSPSHHSIEIEFSGQAAHAGVAPEAGSSAIAAAATALSTYPAGRIDERTTSNFGVIEGGTAANVVAERCRVVAEVRSQDPSSLTRETQAIIEAAHEGAGLHGCQADVVVRPSFVGYQHMAEHPARKVGEAALSGIGVEPEEISSAGGSDANVFELRGLPAVNLGDGSSATHTASERISDQDLTKLAELILALPSAAAATL